MYDLVAKVSANIPSTAVSIAVNHVTESVKFRCGFDVHSVTPALHAQGCTTPCLIVHGANDDFILPKHGSEIAHRFGGAARVDCRLKTPPGGHNSKRPLAVYAEAEAFLRKYLMADAPPVIDLRARARAARRRAHLHAAAVARTRSARSASRSWTARAAPRTRRRRSRRRPPSRPRRRRARAGSSRAARARSRAGGGAGSCSTRAPRRSSTSSRPRTRARSRSATSRSSRCSRARSSPCRAARRPRRSARARVEPPLARGRHALAAVRRGRRGRARELRDGVALDRARHARAPLHAPRRLAARARRVDRGDQARAPLDAHVAADDEARARDRARAQARVARGRGHAPRAPRELRVQARGRRRVCERHVGRAAEGGSRTPSGTSSEEEDDEEEDDDFEARLRNPDSRRGAREAGLGRWGEDRRSARRRVFASTAVPRSVSTQGVHRHDTKVARPASVAPRVPREVGGTRRSQIGAGARPFRSRAATKRPQHPDTFSQHMAFQRPILMIKVWSSSLTDPWRVHGVLLETFSYLGITGPTTAPSSACPEVRRTQRDHSWTRVFGSMPSSASDFFDRSFHARPSFAVATHSLSSNLHPGVVCRQCSEKTCRSKGTRAGARPTNAASSSIFHPSHII